MADFDPQALVGTCMALAAEAGARGDPPFGAILVDAGGRVVARAANTQVSGSAPTAHAQINLLDLLVSRR